MDIFFCDLCGARVTSVDLKGGLGMRREEDVICGRCLELDQGQRWLAGHQSGVQVIKTTVDQPSVIDVVRDRARTVDKDLASAPIQPVPVAIVQSADDQRTKQLEGEPTQPTAGDGYDITTKIPTVEPDFASAAGSFMALSSPSAEKREVEMVPEDDLPDVQTPEQPISGVIKAPSIKEEPAKVPSRSHRRGSSEMRAVKPPAGKDRSKSSNRLEKQATPKPPTGKVPNSRTSRSNATPLPNRSSKTPAAKGNPVVMKALMIFSVVAILASIVMLIMSRGHKPVQPVESETINISQELIDAVKDARSVAQQALQKTPPVQSELEAARGKIFAVAEKIDAFSKEAKTIGHYTDDDVINMVQQINWPDTKLLVRNLNDELVKLRPSK